MQARLVCCVYLLTWFILVRRQWICLCVEVVTDKIMTGLLSLEHAYTM